MAGTWHTSYTGAVSGTFAAGEYGIGDKIDVSPISFGAVGAGATYKGALSGPSMSGAWTSPIGDGRRSATKGLISLGSGYPLPGVDPVSVERLGRHAAAW